MCITLLLLKIVKKYRAYSTANVRLMVKVMVKYNHFRLFMLCVQIAYKTIKFSLQLIIQNVPKK